MLTSIAPPAGKLPGLDGLRAVAVLLVFLFHFGALPFGWIGVQAFFVLSGFLITQLLSQSATSPLRAYLISFYGRRALRIFPLYFAVLAAFYLASRAGLEAHGLKEGLPFAATYTYNWYHATRFFVHSKLLTHFWSLCVEEQFYLVWPFVVYFVPKARQKGLFIALMVAGPLVRGAEWWLLTSHPAWFHDVPQNALYVVTPTHVDAFAAGAYAALFYSGRALRASLFAVSAVVVTAGALLVAFSAVPAATFASGGYPVGVLPGYGFLWAYSLLNVGSALLIAGLVRGVVFPAFFDSTVLRSIGKVSYGFYVFHFPLQSFVAKALPSAPRWELFAVQLSATLVVSTASYYLFESQVLKLKDRWFPAHASGTLPVFAIPTGIADSSAGGATVTEDVTRRPSEA